MRFHKHPFQRGSATLPSNGRSECHRLARWIVTFLATGRYKVPCANATGWPGGSLRSLLQGDTVLCPNATGWPGGLLRSLLQGDTVLCPNATGWPGGSLRSLLQGDTVLCPNATGWPGGSLRSLLQGDTVLCPNATGWPGGSLRSLLQGDTKCLARMPPAGPVDRYVPCYRAIQSALPECHRLARWIVTFLATCSRKKCQESFAGNRPAGCFAQMTPDTYFSWPLLRSIANAAIRESNVPLVTSPRNSVAKTE